jgi:hypothetical protein
VQAIVDDLLDGVAAHGPDRGVDLVAALAFPLPFPRESFEASAPAIHQMRWSTGCLRVTKPSPMRLETLRRPARHRRSKQSRAV